MSENKTDEKELKTSEDVVDKNENILIDSNLKEILKKVEKSKKLSKEEIEKLKKEAIDSVNFVEKIDEINLDFDKYVIFTDGKEQLIYENGEFFVVSSIDATVKKEKKKKEEAKNMYLEYFIRYVLNPIIKQRDISEHSRSISSPTIQKELNDIKRRVSKKAKEQEKEENLPEIVNEKKSIEKKREDDLEIDDIG